MGNRNTAKATAARIALSLNRPPDTDPAWIRYQLAYDIAKGSPEKIERIQALPLFRIAEGDHIDDVAREPAT